MGQGNPQSGRVGGTEDPAQHGGVSIMQGQGRGGKRGDYWCEVLGVCVQTSLSYIIMLFHNSARGVFCATF